MALWGGRFTSGSSNLFRQVNDSLPFDHVMAVEDMTGSIVWSQALLSVGVLTEDEQNQIESTLKGFIAQVESGELDMSASEEEDIHSSSSFDAKSSIFFIRFIVVVSKFRTGM